MPVKEASVECYAISKCVKQFGARLSYETREVDLDLDYCTYIPLGSGMVHMDLVDATSRNCHLRMRGSGQEEADCTKWASCRSCNLGMCFVFF